MAPKKQRSVAQRDLDLKHIAELKHRGLTQTEIGQQLGLTQQTVSNDLRLLRKRAVEAAQAEMLDIIAEELSLANYLQFEALDGWMRSKEDAVIKLQKSEQAGSAGKKTSAQVKTVGQVGDPRFLQTVLNLAQHRLDLLGIYDLLKGAGDEGAKRDYLDTRRRVDQLLEDKRIAAEIDQITKAVSAGATEQN